MLRTHNVACLVGLAIVLPGCGEQPSKTEPSATTASLESPDQGTDPTTATEQAVQQSEQDSHAKASNAEQTVQPAARDAHDKASHGGDGSHRNGNRRRHPGIARTAGLKVGDAVPDFEVSINGETRTLAELRADRQLTEDGTLVLTFWCSFCHSCRDVEMHLNALAEKYKTRAGVIAIDSSAGETAEEVAEFAKSRGLTLPIALDSKAAVADMFGIRVTTTTVVIDAEGVLRYCGQFAAAGHSYAEDALMAVLNHKDVVVAETRLRG